MGKINAEWHKKNKMPKNPAIDQKIKWHEGHAKNCACRDSVLHLAKLKSARLSYDNLKKKADKFFVGHFFGRIK